MHHSDLVVIGGGIVGLATAWQYQRRHPDHRIVVLEKEDRVAMHQTGHNSGVLHSGIYYAPGSLKARTCTAGRAEMVEFCAEHGIAHEICGKVIVATEPSELPRLAKLAERGAANGVRCTTIGPERLLELEPYARGLEAIHVLDTGIVDFAAVAQKLAELLCQGGAEVHTEATVLRVREDATEVVVQTTRGDYRAERTVSCAGLHADRVARASGLHPQARIVPFRGEYFSVREGAPELCRNLIYPVPDPAFPFLGVHFTRTIHGTIETGPNAVLALAREGYRKSTIHLRDACGTLTYPGFLRLALRHGRTGVMEMWRSFRKPAFVRALARLVPEVRAEHLLPAPAGVRAQAVGHNGELVDDFLVLPTPRMLHVCNAPSPAATASLHIGANLAARLG